MRVMPISPERLHEVRRAAIAEAQSRPAKGVMRGGDGVLVRRIPRTAFLNAVVNHGVDPQDEGYWRDMERLYPECKVAYTSDKVRVIMGQQPGLALPGLRNRFGRVTWRKVYA